MMGTDPEKDKEYQQFIQQLLQQGQDPRQFSDEEREALYADFKGRRAELSRQRQLADSMRGPMQGGRSAGNVYKAQNPLEALSNVANNAVGAKMEQNAAEKAEQLSQKDETAREASAIATAEAIKGLRGATQPAGAQPAPVRPGQPLTPEQRAQLERKRRGGFTT